MVIQPGSSHGSPLIEAVSNALLRPSSRLEDRGWIEPREKSNFNRPSRLMIASTLFVFITKKPRLRGAKQIIEASPIGGVRGSYFDRDGIPGEPPPI
jgi:hypothetical protein